MSYWFLSRILSAALLCGMLAGPVMAGPILPVSYDMANGHGHPSGGWRNYWDKSYDGLGSVTTDNAPLTGGLGDLVDGVIPTLNWNFVENNEGTGPYVGWINVNPTILFHFDAGEIIEEVYIPTDDSHGQGGVSPPSAVVINGVSYAVVRQDPSSRTPFAIGVTGLALSGTVSVQLMRDTPWVFISEVQFAGQESVIASATDVPEPGTMMLLAGGLVGLAGVRRRIAAR